MKLRVEGARGEVGEELGLAALHVKLGEVVDLIIVEGYQQGLLVFEGGGDSGLGRLREGNLSPFQEGEEGEPVEGTLLLAYDKTFPVRGEGGAELGPGIRCEAGKEILF